MLLGGRLGCRELQHDFLSLSELTCFWDLVFSERIQTAAIRNFRPRCCFVDRQVVHFFVCRVFWLTMYLVGDTAATCK